LLHELDERRGTRRRVDAAREAQAPLLERDLDGLRLGLAGELRDLGRQPGHRWPAR
jgi:hypothetical protein